MSENFYYGGQAVIEGVMMRGKDGLATAVRKPSGDVVIKRDPISSVTARFPILKKPLIRGVVSLVESLIVGMRALSFSASQFSEEEEEQIGPKEIIFSMVLAFGLTALLFVVAPAFVIKQVQHYISSNILLNLIEGLIKISFFLIYVLAISFMKDIRRVFEYHGAEHKTINTYEAGEELTVENVKKHTRFHKRCGTSFLVIVLIVNTVVFSFFGRPPFLLRILYHLLLMPVVAGISYEVIRRAGRPNAPWLIKALSYPGILTQYITTREPDGLQIEVAIKSLKSVLPAEEQPAITHLDGTEGVVVP
jgi:uncharacterized protein YqhQ